MTEEYTEEQKQDAREAAAQLMGWAEKMAAFMHPHAINTAFMGATLEILNATMHKEATIRWLLTVAEELEKAAEQEILNKDNVIDLNDYTHTIN